MGMENGQAARGIGMLDPFTYGKFEGFGRYEWSDGRVYEGGFRDGKKHGKKARYKLKSGKVYIGQWENDQPSGFLTFTYESGRTGKALPQNRGNGQFGFAEF